jgi:ABC-type enterochelin transport system substrate-binding protein
MRRCLSLAVSALVLTAFALAGYAEAQKGEEKKAQEIAGKVTAVDVKAKTVTIKNKDKVVTLDAAGIKDLGKIKVGDQVVAAYAEKGGKMVAASIKPAKKAEPSKKPGAPGY